MSIFNKIKNILFDEEEVEIPVIGEKKEPARSVIEKPAALPKEEEPVKNILFDDEEIVVKKEVKPLDDDLFKREVKPSRSLNILDYERRETKKERPAFFKKEEKKEEPFKPSPVISPVYGIIEPNQTIEPIKASATPKPRSTGPIDIDEIRRKAYGTLEDDIERTLEKTVDKFYAEEKEAPKEKSIDELLINDIDNTNELPELRPRKTPIDILDDIDNGLDNIREEAKELKDIDPDDTIESDLFNLIDSMYEKREEGEE